MAHELNAFVKEALEKKVSREQIAEALNKAGWDEDEIKAALQTFAEADFPIPVPRRKPYLSAREAFLYLVLFLTLYIGAISFGTLIFQFVNRALPDPLTPYFDNTQTIRSALAALIVSSPIYFSLAVYLARSIRQKPEKKHSKVRKWLTYVTLFIAAGVIIGDLIALLNGLLAGELTVRFAIKVVTVFVIAGTIFGYYLWDLRKEEKEQ
jgi:hypothetical protein